jgi:outer membrane protein assembly factor BamA
MSERAICIILFAALFPAASMADVRITAIEVTGNYRTDPGIIGNYLYLHEGDVMSREELAERVSRSETRLLNTRYFSTASVSTVFEDEVSVRINVSVKEGFLWRFNAGTWFIQLGRDNLFGKGLDGTLHLSKSTQSVILDNPYLGGTPFLWRMGITHQLTGRDIVYVEPEEDFDYERIGASWTIGYNFNPDLSVALNTGVHAFELEDKEFGTDALVFLRDNGVHGRTKDTFLGLSLRLDRRNDRLTPSDGFLTQGALEYRDGAPGVRFELLDYREMGTRAYLFSRLSLTSFGNHLPYHLWKGLGGIWGLKFPDSEDQIGRSTVLLSIEPRFRFLEIPSYNSFFEARVFLDTGAAVLKASDIAFDRLISGYGVGLRLWIGYPYYQNAVVYYGIRRGEGELFLRLGTSF